MVFPASLTKDVVINGKTEKRYRPRSRQFTKFSNLNFYNIFIQNYKGDLPLKIKKIAKLAYENYPKIIEILYLNRNKLKIVTSDITTANALLMDEKFTKEYRVTVPFDDVEIKGVVGIPHEDDDGSTITEESIYNKCTIKHKPEFGIIECVEDIKIVEVKRFTKFNKDKTPNPLNRVLLTFSGKTLPSHVNLDNILFPVTSYREPVLQCFKCYRYKHSTRACNKNQAICRRCAKHHSISTDESTQCSLSPSCVNCKGSHASNDRSCPVFLKHKAKNEEKAAMSQPKKTPNFFNLVDFPPLGSLRPKKNVWKENCSTQKEKILSDSSTTVSQMKSSSLEKHHLPSLENKQSSMEVPEINFSSINDDHNPAELSDISISSSEVLGFENKDMEMENFSSLEIDINSKRIKLSKDESDCPFDDLKSTNSNNKNDN